MLAEHGLPGCSVLGQMLQGSLLNRHSVGLLPLLHRQLGVRGWARPRLAHRRAKSRCQQA